MPALSDEASRHVTDKGSHWHDPDDPELEAFRYTVFECKYDDCGKRWVPADDLPGELQDASNDILDHVEIRHGVET